MILSNRRQVLASAFGALAVSQAQPRAQAQEPAVRIPGKRSLFVHNDRPEDLETPNEYLDTWITPVDAFFVRQHIPRPTVDLQTWRLEIGGRVSKPLKLALADLRKLPQQKVPATLECTGNGRGFYRPRVPGIQWMRGAIGNAEWTGPRLADILKLAGSDNNAGYITTNGADVGVAQTPDFIRSMPMRKVLDPATLIALDMNGQPIPSIHGGPARLIVPGWDGTSWVKWVVSIDVTADANNGFFMNPAYRIPKFAIPPGGAAVPSELEVIEGMPVKSAITAPEEGPVKMGPLVLKGIAWAGERRVARVDISTDGGSKWSPATLSKEDLPFAWRLWRLNWTPPQPGYYTILSRATDSAGNVQPFVPAWNPSGYLWNGIDRVGITVEKAA